MTNPQKWYRPICWFRGHNLEYVDPTNYLGWAEGKHEKQVPVCLCERCGKQWWVDEDKL